MDIIKKQNLLFRLVLCGLVLLCVGISTLAILALVAYKPEDFIFSLVVVVIAIVFELFEIIMTLVNIKKVLSLLKIGFTDRGYVNPIPMIAILIGLVIGFAMTVTGIVLFFVRPEPIIKCNSLVILSIGIYLLLNCVFYVIFVLVSKKHINN